MNKAMLFFSAFFLLAGPAMAGIQITGRILGADGRPPALAHVHVSRLGESYSEAFATVQAKRDGTFSLVLEPPGYYTLWFTAVHHYATPLHVLTTSNQDEIALTFTPEPYAYVDTFDVVKIIGGWNDFSFSTADTMRKQEDGTFVFEVRAAADTLAYQLLQVEKKGHSIQGTMQDYYIYDRGGDYLSVLRTRPGETVRIVFDPKKWPEPSDNRGPSATFDQAHKYLETVHRLNQKMRLLREEYGTAYRQYRQANQDLQGFSFDVTPYLEYFQGYMDSERHPVVRSFAAMSLLQTRTYARKIQNDSTLVSHALRYLSPETPLWALAPYLITGVTRYLDEKKRQDYIGRVLNNHPDQYVRGIVLANLAMEAKFEGDKEKWLAYYKQLKDRYGELKRLRFHLQYLDPDKKIAVGNPVPDFSVKLMGSDQTVSKKSLMGRFYLMDFWATWCGPCLAELPYLHKAWQRFKDKNFTILSLSFDRRPDIVETFRKKKWKMPWLHTFVENGFRSELAKKFEVLGIPKPVLVGPDGTILATEERLRGDKLLQTLARYLEERETSEKN